MKSRAGLAIPHDILGRQEGGDKDALTGGPTVSRRPWSLARDP